MHPTIHEYLMRERLESARRTGERNRLLVLAGRAKARLRRGKS
jgi:hypothetical protein